MAVKEKAVKNKSVVITDPLIEPFYIKFDSDQYSLHKRIPSGHEMQAMGYYTTLGGALRNIAKNQMYLTNQGEAIDSIHDWLTQQDNILTAFTDRFL